MTSPDTIGLELELAEARHIIARLRRVLGRVLDLYPEPMTVETTIEARRLYNETGQRPAWERAVVVGERQPGTTISLQSRLMYAGLTPEAARTVAKQPLHMPVKLAPGVVISVFEIPTGGDA